MTKNPSSAGEFLLGTKPVKYDTPKIILLNGAPRSGKDTFGKRFAKKHGGKVMKFAEPIKAACAAMYCGGSRALFDSYDTPEEKDKAHAVFFGKTTREVQISISEEYMKPLYGQDIFGHILSNSLDRDIQDERRAHSPVYFITDSGFDKEAFVLINRFGVENIKLIRLHRDGHTFKGDSRGYVNLDKQGITGTDIDNIEGEQQRTIGLIEIALHNFL